MSSSSSTIPVKYTEDKIIRFALLTLWAVLALFGLISLFQPGWLVGISSEGRMSEAMDYQKIGNAFLQKGSFRDAAANYTKAIKIQPDFTDAYGNLGICYSRLNRYDEAIRIFKYLLKTDTENIYTNYYNLADLYKRQGNINSSIEWYVKSAEINPFPIYSYQYLGELYLKLEKWDLAIKSFELALANTLTMKNSYYGMLKGVKNSSKDKPEIMAAVNKYLDKAIEPNLYDDDIFGTALATNKEIAKTYNFLGYAHSKEMNLLKAKQNYSLALKIWPRFSEAKRNLKNLNELIKENS